MHERWKNETVPRLELLAPGQYVLCKYFGPKDNRTEWHRAMILRNPAFEDKPGLVNKFKSIGKLSESEILSIGLKVWDSEFKFRLSKALILFLGCTC